MVANIIEKIIGYINSQDINLLRVATIKHHYLAAINPTIICDIGSEEEPRNVFYSEDVQYFYLGEGIILNFFSGHERFGSSILSGEGLEISSIFADKNISLFFREIYSNGNPDESKLTVSGPEDIREVFEFINKNSKNIEREDVISYLASYNSTVNIYKILSDELKRDNAIIEAIINKIYQDSKSQYSEIVEYNRISPYGGEDISYFPNSEEHCFMDNIFSEAEQLGIKLDHWELEKKAYNLLSNNNQMRVINEFSRDFEHKTKCIEDKKKILSETKKYAAAADAEESFMEKINRLESEIKKLKEELIILEEVYSHDVLRQKPDLIESEIQKYNWILKLVFNKKYLHLVKQKEAIEKYFLISSLLSKHNNTLKEIEFNKNNIFNNVKFPQLIRNPEGWYVMSCERVRDLIYEYKKFIKDNSKRYMYLQSLKSKTS